MGLGLSKPSVLVELIQQLLNLKTKLVLDASALIPDILDAISHTGIIVTPHAGEFKRLFKEHPGNTLEEIKSNLHKLAKDYGLTIVLKGWANVISDGDKIVVVKRSTPAMTVGGTGDVLSGLIAGLLTRNDSAFEASVLAVSLNGNAAMRVYKRVGLHMVATDLIKELPSVLRDFEENNFSSKLAFY
jgi:ADP-dependent NAD(P)H-hydrate dehydratase